MLIEAEPFAGCTLAGAARKLKISRATLARRLQSEGMTYQALKEELRRDRAIALLASNASIGEIAERVGYSETSAFTRAFRNWTGVSPRQYRAGRRPPLRE